MLSLLDPPRTRPPRRAPISLETRAQHERTDRACAELLRRPSIISVSAYQAVRATTHESPPSPSSLDYSIETHNPVSTALQRREFIRTWSTNTRLRGCGATYLRQHRKWNSCEHPLCDTCARQRASSRAADLAAITGNYNDVIAVTLSIRSNPESPLADLWDALDTARGQFVGDWLKTRVSGWRWSTEITHSNAGWHPHAAFLVFGNDLELDTIEAECINRWTGIVRGLGYYADPDAQHVEKITRTRGKALRYASKGLSEGPAGSVTPGVLLDHAAAGDGEAAALWVELDEAAHDRRFQGTGGALRRRN